ncbi:MAG TPA: hypothetical protein VJ851_15715 [Jatrophihabitans sp.]|nr:hypothetical protein [Jatrophihabitans sp.]
MDGGRTWTALPPPARFELSPDAFALDADLYFADARNGFVFLRSGCDAGCSSGLEATHDAGASWHFERLPELAQLLSGAGTVYAVSSSSGLWRSMLGTDLWTQVARPGSGQPLQVAGQATTLLALRQGGHLAIPGGDPGGLWLSTDGGRSWTPRPMPCHPATDGGAALVSIARAHPQAWLLDCYNNQQSSQEIETRHHLYGTADGGRTWIRLTDPTRHGAPDLMADNGGGHAFLTTTLGGGSTLLGSFDGASHWQTLLPIGDGGQGQWADLQFTDSQTGTVVAPTGRPMPQATRRLYRTVDAGQHWAPVTLPTQLE